MVSNEQYDDAVARCEAAARDRAHTLSVWYPVDERLHAALCEECGEMVWIARSNCEGRWRVGGVALKQDCWGRDAT